MKLGNFEVNYRALSGTKTLNETSAPGHYQLTERTRPTSVAKPVQNSGTKLRSSLLKPSIGSSLEYTFSCSGSGTALVAGIA